MTNIEAWNGAPTTQNTLHVSRWYHLSASDNIFVYLDTYIHKKTCIYNFYLDWGFPGSLISDCLNLKNLFSSSHLTILGGIPGSSLMYELSNFSNTRSSRTTLEGPKIVIFSGQSGITVSCLAKYPASTGNWLSSFVYRGEIEWLSKEWFVPENNDIQCSTMQCGREFTPEWTQS